MCLILFCSEVRLKLIMHSFGKKNMGNPCAEGVNVIDLISLVS